MPWAPPPALPRNLEQPRPHVLCPRLPQPLWRPGDAAVSLLVSLPSTAAGPQVKLGGRPGAPGAPPWWARLGSESHAAGLAFSGSPGAGPALAPTPRWRVWGSPGCSSVGSVAPGRVSEVCSPISACPALCTDFLLPCSGFGMELPPPVIREQQTPQEDGLLAWGSWPCSRPPCTGLSRAAPPSLVPEAEAEGAWLPRIPAAAPGWGASASPSQAWKRLRVLLCPQICDKSPDLCRPSLIFFFPSNFIFMYV